MRNRPTAPLKNAGRFSTAAATADGGIKDWLTLAELRDAAEGWLLDGEVRLSPKTVHDRRNLMNKVLWWMETFEQESCGKREMQMFFVYLRTAHESKEGRWGEPGTICRDDKLKKAMRPQSAGNYFRWLRTFFLFLVEDGTLDASPLRTLKPPRHKDDQVQPFSMAQVDALLRAAGRTRSARRDEAIILTLLDTGCRAAELCGLRYADFDMRERSLRVLGKGNTHRTLYLSPRTTRAIQQYLRQRRPEEDEPLFAAEGGTATGEALTPNGLHQVVKRLGQAAGIDGVRCSPHTFRHTFAVEYLRNGGDPLTLQALYGHTSLEMTRKYVQFAGADMKRSHAAHSPVAKMKKR